MSWWYMMRNNVGLERKESLDNPIQDVSLEHLILQEERNNKLSKRIDNLTQFLCFYLTMQNSSWNWFSQLKKIIT